MAMGRSPGAAFSMATTSLSQTLASGSGRRRPRGAFFCEGSRRSLSNRYAADALNPAFAAATMRALFGNVTEPDRALRTFVRDRLAEGWTPEQISGWLKRGNERRCVLGEVSAFSWSNWGALPDKASGSRRVAPRGLSQQRRM